MAQFGYAKLSQASDCQLDREDYAQRMNSYAEVIACSHHDLHTYKHRRQVYMMILKRNKQKYSHLPKIHRGMIHNRKAQIIQMHKRASTHILSEELLVPQRPKILNSKGHLTSTYKSQLQPRIETAKAKPFIQSTGLARRPIRDFKDGSKLMTESSWLL